jgi:hypothetical protein
VSRTDSYLKTFLGINGIDVRRSQTGVIRFNADASVVLYFALTVPLTVATLLLWWAWEKWSRLRRSENGANFGNISGSQV